MKAADLHASASGRSNACSRDGTPSRNLRGTSVAATVAPPAGPTLEMGVLGMQRTTAQRALGKDTEALAPSVPHWQRSLVAGLRRHLFSLARCRIAVRDAAAVADRLR